MKLRQLFEDAGKTVAVTFGRLNPPTIGHQKLIDAVLKQKADAHFLFVSQTQKTTGKNQTRLSNPIPFDTKLGFIQKAFPNINIGDTSANTVIGMLQYLEKQGFENVIFVGGSDRVAAFEELFNKQNGVDYNLKSINVVSSGDRDPDADGAEGMSASKMRAAAIANDFESFKTGLPAGLQGDAKTVFTAVRQGLEPWLETTAEEDFFGGAKSLGPWFLKKDGDVLRTVNGEPFKFKSKEDAVKWAMKTYKVSYKQQRIIPTVNPDKNLVTTEAPIEMDPSEPMNPMIYGAGGNPAKLQYRMMRAANQLKDLSARAREASPSEWQIISKQFDELAMNISQIKHGLEELAKQRRKGGVRSRGIDPMIDSVEEGWKSKMAGAALAAANLLGSPAQAEEPVKPITIAYVMIDGEMRKYNLGDKFDNARDAEKFISDILDKKGLSGYTLDIKHGYPKKKEVKESYGRYWCSTDKKWKARKGPKQKRS
jgi:hypothetical protein